MQKLPPYVFSFPPPRSRVSHVAGFWLALCFVTPLKELAGLDYSKVIPFWHRAPISILATIGMMFLLWGLFGAVDAAMDNFTSQYAPNAKRIWHCVLLCSCIAAIGLMVS
ncbi:hypothetical protein [Viridibacterium curvum]|uniref:Uncharacterized protein n=1 Tax=Viridibacterium curvum TaxID=1101404 RepID=A0ABP9R0A8_9RHOO